MMQATGLSTFDACATKRGDAPHASLGSTATSPTSELAASRTAN